jgi:hypothetical protein
MTAPTVTLKVWWQGPGRALPRFELDGERISLAALAKLYGLPEYAVMARISRGLHPSQWFLAPEELSRLTKQAARRAA